MTSSVPHEEGTRLRVQYDDASAVHEMIDWLVESDTLELRDLAWNLLHDLECLRAAVSRITTERDEAREAKAETARQWQDAYNELARSSHGNVQRAWAAATEATAEIARMRPVVEAAEAWCAAEPADTVDSFDHALKVRDALAAAVDMSPPYPTGKAGNRVTERPRRQRESDRR